MRQPILSIRARATSGIPGDYTLPIAFAENPGQMLASACNKRGYKFSSDPNSSAALGEQLP